ncbi:MAG: TMEM165/GDT1 family protein [Thermoplasmata archaeon]|nr:MAG: TMEM165/GDT1 family protein [Thermoplasmata archaeon]
MDWFIPLTVTFVAIFLAELGDKTQLVTISFASKYPHVPVFFGVFLGMSMITVLGVVLGTILFEFIPIIAVKILSGLIFLIFGVWTLLKREEEEEEVEDQDSKKIDDKSIFSTTFIMISLAEFGDKTQFAVIALTAQYGSPFMVLLGAVLAFALIVGIGVVLGKKLSEKVSTKWIEFGSGILFIVIGILFIAEALLF